MKARLTARVEFGFVGPTRSIRACNALATAQAHDNESDYTASRRSDNKRAMQQVLDVCEESDGDRKSRPRTRCRIANSNLAVDLIEDYDR
jgi:hypothetical protein